VHESFIHEQKKTLLGKLARYLREARVHSPLKRRIAIPFIRAALERIEEGSYGRCVDCGKPIAPARLRAVPGAIRCTPCQEEADRG
jgi:RNA polymerase-binding transcription factor DksA